MLLAKPHTPPLAACPHKHMHSEAETITDCLGPLLDSYVFSFMGMTTDKIYVALILFLKHFTYIISNWEMGTSSAEDSSEKLSCFAQGPMWGSESSVLSATPDFLTQHSCWAGTRMW